MANSKHNIGHALGAYLAVLIKMTVSSSSSLNLQTATVPGPISRVVSALAPVSENLKFEPTQTVNTAAEPVTMIKPPPPPPPPDPPKSSVSVPDGEEYPSLQHLHPNAKARVARLIQLLATEREQREAAEQRCEAAESKLAAAEEKLVKSEQRLCTSLRLLEGYKERLEELTQERVESEKSENQYRQASQGRVKEQITDLRDVISSDKFNCRGMVGHPNGNAKNQVQQEDLDLDTDLSPSRSPRVISGCTTTSYSKSRNAAGGAPKEDLRDSVLDLIRELNPGTAHSTTKGQGGRGTAHSRTSSTKAKSGPGPGPGRGAATSMGIPTRSYGDNFINSTNSRSDSKKVYNHNHSLNHNESFSSEKESDIAEVSQSKTRIERWAQRELDWDSD